MCLILFATKVHPDWPLVIAANRDEWRDRGAQEAHWWWDTPTLLAGRDLRAGGTWMGVTRAGRIAAITNFRDPADRRSNAPSRGQLVTECLIGAMQPDDYLATLSMRAAEFNAFNLVAGDADGLWIFGSRERGVRKIPPGVHGLSNHVLDEPWPKVSRGRKALSRILKEGARDIEPLFDLLGDTTQPPDAALPDTGVGITWERMLSPALIRGVRYGTRCSTVLMVGRDRRVIFEERTRDAKGGVTGTARHEFTLG
jgi:uncharacterized protein with NRDE domain